MLSYYILSKLYANIMEKAPSQNAWLPTPLRTTLQRSNEGDSSNTGNIGGHMTTNTSNGGRRLADNGLSG